MFAPKIIGIYGLPGAGKSTLLSKLQPLLGHDRFRCIEGAAWIDAVQDGGMSAFHTLDDATKTEWRESAITSFRTSCQHSSKHGILAGHYMFWKEDEKAGEEVWTKADGETYTHILYLDTDAATVQTQCAEDVSTGRRQRAVSSLEHLEKWKRNEREKLREVCYKNGIIFGTIKPDEENDVVALIEDFVEHNEADNTTRVLQQLENFSPLTSSKADTILVFDCDKTLAAVDVGEMFCKRLDGYDGALTKIFRSMGYSHKAFYQAMLLLQEACPSDKVATLYDELARSITIQPQILHLLRQAAEKENVGVVFVTCGIGRVWQKVVEREGLLDSVAVVGSGRLSQGIVVSPEVKRRVVEYLQEEHQARVWAFGDSPVDLPMLKQADHAVVVVCDETIRSKTMEKALGTAIARDGLQARQLLLPVFTTPRLSPDLLPAISSEELRVQILSPTKLKILHATDEPFTKLLAGPTRDSSMAGAALRRAHRRVGEYVARVMLPRITGLEEYEVESVQGIKTKIHRIRDESKTTVVSIMRGGDPMALGVGDVLSSAMYVHAKEADQLKAAEVVGQSTVLLCDFVINEGETMVKFVKRVRELNATARIVMMAGVVQAGVVREDSHLSKGVRGLGDVSLVALRLSENKYKGKGKTDTGARLFNTTDLEKV